ncbi:MAG: phosphoenolpyruvate--protein phosphotransferase [Candidatus Latescibacteria bacterium]|nr:phosphoenolpyruvate--protein phosphotransferase [Candidatus Latescibacterota bacterium]
MSQQCDSFTLSGVPASAGVAIGRAFIYNKEIPPLTKRRIPANRVEAEVERFLGSVYQAGEEIRRTQRLVELEHGIDLGQIFGAQLTMLEDPEIRERTLARIRQRRYAAEYAFSLTLEETKRMFAIASIDNEYLRMRLSDVMDIENQVLISLAGGEGQALHSLRANTVIVGHDVLPSEAIQLGGRRVKGIVTDIGGATSHTSIIARSMGLPSVVGTGRASRAIQSGDVIIVDGDDGVVHVRPSLETLRHHKSRLRRQARRRNDLDQQRQLPAVTEDGVTIELMANVDVPDEVQRALEYGAGGVGMYRTEFLYLNYRLPDEQAQYEAYTQIIEALAPKPVVIRTVDMGGDKLSKGMDRPPEANPFLGWRGIRICLDMPDLFKTQLRALFRAARKGPVSILLPMISSLDEWHRTQAIIAETKADLCRERVEFEENCPVGIMVEVPSVALMVERFAREVDFFSIGTNDLTQYTLAVDRGTAQVSALYDPFHPSVLKLIQMVAASGDAHRVPVSICGEMGGDPLATPLLVGLGLRCLSLSPGLIPEVKAVIRSISAARARQIADTCLGLDTAREVRDFIKEQMSV